MRNSLLNQKSVAIFGPELLRLDFRISQTEEILISRTNHQLYFILNLRISFVSHSPQNPGRHKIRDNANQI